MIYQCIYVSMYMYVCNYLCMYVLEKNPWGVDCLSGCEVAGVTEILAIYNYVEVLDRNLPLEREEREKRCRLGVNPISFFWWLTRDFSFFGHGCQNGRHGSWQQYVSYKMKISRENEWG